MIAGRRMARVLALDTSLHRCAVALVVGGEAVAERWEEMRRGHAERLFPIIEELFAATGGGFGDLDAITVSTGPGSFSGIRIGVSAARGLALSLDVPACGANVLEALAEEAAGENAAPHSIVAVNAAPRERAYLQMFEAPGDGTANACDSPQLVEPGVLKCIRLPNGSLAVGNAADRIGGPHLTRKPCNGLPNLAALARVAMRLRNRGSARPVPEYVRPPDAMPRS